MSNIVHYSAVNVSTDNISFSSLSVEQRSRFKNSFLSIKEIMANSNHRRRSYKDIARQFKGRKLAKRDSYGRRMHYNTGYQSPKIKFVSVCM